MADVYMQQALALAEEALLAGEVPVGAVVVKGGAVIGQGRNRRQQDRDPLAHAELLAIRQAARALGDWRLNGCTLYVTLEPCPMCAGAIVQSRLDAVIFGAWDEHYGCCGSCYNLPADARLQGHARVAGGLMQEACAALLTRYFQQRRAQRP
nr:tRNA adenosine(34) deaminase TadA [Maliibacterium massiliense]